MTVVVMVTVADRVALLNRFLLSLERHAPELPVHVHVQGDYARWREEVIVPTRLTIADVMCSPEPLGCHAARILSLRAIGQADTYVNVDDDVALIEHTHWGPAIEKAHEPGVGFVLTNWVKYPSQLPKAIKIMREEFLPQAMVYNGGGMAYTDAVAELIRALDPVPARFDDLWPLTAYLAGYRNYRYRGSLAVHSILSSGGMQSYMKAEPRPLLCWEWINYRLSKTEYPVGREYCIPEDRDIKTTARELHRKRRAERGWS